MRLWIGWVMAAVVFCAGPVGAQSRINMVSSLRDQESVEVTVYNSNLGLVKDVRNIKLPEGDGRMQFMDVAAYIKPETVSIRSLTAPQDLSILEQNYEYDLINSTKLLDKYVGKKLKLVNRHQFQDKVETVEAELLSNNQGQIYKIGNEIHIGHPGQVILPTLPDDLVARPTLTWAFRNRGTSPQNIEVSYLTDNINWKADYIVAIDKDDAKADVSGWVTLDNKSGTTYRNAKLKLVAGQVNRVQAQQHLRAPEMMMARSMSLAADVGFQQESFFEYHLYDLAQPTTVADLQTKQIRLLEASGAKISKIFRVQGQNPYWYSRFTDSGKVPVNVLIRFQNSKENNMGFPLPAGIMRLYKADSKGSLQFIGEDAIKHTPKDEDVLLKIGEAFDVVAERVQMDYQNVNRGHESEWEVTIRNRKEEPISVQVLESIPGSWTVVSQSHKFTKVDAFTARFDVDVPQGGEVKVRYRVRIRY